MKLHWFKQKDIFFVPITVVGWMILIASIAYAIYDFRVIDRKSHSVSDTLMNIAFHLLIIVAIYTITAMLTSTKQKPKD